MQFEAGIIYFTVSNSGLLLPRVAGTGFPVSLQLVIKIGFFDKINYSMTVSAFKQACDRKDREVFFTNVPQVGTFH